MAWLATSLATQMLRRVSVPSTHSKAGYGDACLHTVPAVGTETGTSLRLAGQLDLTTLKILGSVEGPCRM